ncbi:MAG: lamin tail domain-containing protein [Chloroflexus sp.]|nr:lamin tail domain-containing protein [Chloroflexus sp.]
MPYQRYRLLTLLFIPLVMISGALLLATQLVYAQPTPISCPRNQTVTLSGANAPPLQGLIVIFAGQPVGGGFSDAAGNWRIPLRTNEPAGIYPVEVRVRADQRVLASLLCYVDVPLPGMATPPPAETPTLTNTPTPRRTATLTATSTATPTAVPAATFTATVAGPRATPTPTTVVRNTSTPTSVTQGTTTATPVRATNTPITTATATVTGGAPTRTPTLVPAGLAVTMEIVPYDPNSSASLNEEYVILRSEEENDLTIAGWRIVNISRPERPTFVFPAFILQPEVEVYLYTGNGTNNLSAGDFYWNLNAPVWRKGDVAHLIDAQGRLVRAYQVP